MTAAHQQDTILTSDAYCGPAHMKRSEQAQHGPFSTNDGVIPCLDAYQEASRSLAMGLQSVSSSWDRPAGNALAVVHRFLGVLCLKHLSIGRVDHVIVVLQTFVRQRSAIEHGGRGTRMLVRISSGTHP